MVPEPKTVCQSPAIVNGEVSLPSEEIAIGESYDVTCNEGFSLSGSSSTMVCNSGGDFDQTPTCTG